MFKKLLNWFRELQERPYMNCMYDHTELIRQGYEGCLCCGKELRKWQKV